MNLKKTIISSSMVLTLILSRCAVNFAGKTPVSTSDSFRFITGNEVISKDNYTVKGVVVVQRMKWFFALPGGLIYFLPLGSAQVTIQATAIDIK